MSINLDGSLRTALSAAWAGVMLLGCGGGDAPVAVAPGEQTFDSRAAALTAQPASNVSPRTLTVDVQAEVQRRSREWAVAAIMDSMLPAGSVLTVPPLYFGLAFALDAAAGGTTRAELRQQFEPADTAVQAALQRGLERIVQAGPATTFTAAFLDAVTSAQETGTFARLSLQPMNAEQLQRDPSLRMWVSDGVGTHWAWPRGRAYQGVHTQESGQREVVPMVEVQGTVLDHASTGFEASSMDVGNGHWLVRVVPRSAPAAFGAAGLAAALAELVPRLGQPAAGGTTSGLWRLPQTGTAQSAGLGDRRGMALAMDPVNADLRGMGSGGNYLKAPPGSGFLSIGGSGLTYSASQSFAFIFSPMNLSGSTAAGGGFTNIDSSQPPCPVEQPVDLRPYFLAVVQPGGNVALLARMDSHTGTACRG